MRIVTVLSLIVPSLFVAASASAQPVPELGRAPATLVHICRQGSRITRAELFSFFRARRVSNMRFLPASSARSIVETQRQVLERLTHYPLLKAQLLAALPTLRAEWDQEAWSEPQPVTIPYLPTLDAEAGCRFEKLADSGQSGDGPVILSRRVYRALPVVQQAAAQIEQAMIRSLQKLASPTVQPSLESLSQNVTASMFVSPFSHDILKQKAWVAELIVGQVQPLSGSFGALIPPGLYSSVGTVGCSVRILPSISDSVTFQFTDCPRWGVNTRTLSCNTNICYGQLEAGVNAIILLTSVSQRLFKVEIAFAGHGPGSSDISYYHP